MMDLAREAARVAKALKLLARDLDRKDPVTRQHDRSLARMLHQLANGLDKAVDAATPPLFPPTDDK